MMPRVFHFERLAGCDQRILAMFAWWMVHGPFPITIPQAGGKRSDEETQARLFAKGRTTLGPHAGQKGYPKLGLIVTNARTLADTPHGRGGAADAYPAIVGPNAKVLAILDNVKDPRTLSLFTMYGDIAEQQFGLEWGGRWRMGDFPHVQLKDWRTLPKP